jgi:hypothetical protein
MADCAGNGVLLRQGAIVAMIAAGVEAFRGYRVRQAKFKREEEINEFRAAFKASFSRGGAYD